MKTINAIRILSASFALALLVSGNAAAQQTKVVVIPLAGDDVQPSFRIVPTTANEEAATSGRLEFTSDKNPSPRSNWGKVCNDCFEGNNDCFVAPIPSTNAASIAVCKDLGYLTGQALTSAPNNTGGLGFTLDDVICPDGAQSFSECSSREFNTSNCVAGEEVDIQCFAEAPKIVVPGFTLDCSAGFSNPDANRFENIDDSDLNTPFLFEKPTGSATVLLRWGFTPAEGDGRPPTINVQVRSTPYQGTEFEETMVCDGSTEFLRNGSAIPSIVIGENGFQWRMTTDITTSAAGVMNVADIVFELIP